MNKKEKTSNINVTLDAEILALANAYVQTAMERKMSQKQILDITRQLCQEFVENSKPKRVVLILEENEEQKIFREKARAFLQDYPKFIRFYPDSDNLDLHRTYTLEIICAIYRMFLEEDYVTQERLVLYIQNYFYQYFENPKFSKKCNIDYFTKQIFYALDRLVFQVGNYSAIGFTKHVNYSYKPIYCNEIPKFHSDLKRIDEVAEPRLMEKEHFSQKCKTSLKMIQLIWTIETFF